jgi:hypothetical protein
MNPLSGFEERGLGPVHADPQESKKRRTNAHQPAHDPN